MTSNAPATLYRRKGKLFATKNFVPGNEFKYINISSNNTISDIELLHPLELTNTDFQISEDSVSNSSLKLFKNTERLYPEYEEQFLDLLSAVYKYGETRTDRTGTGTKSLFGKSIQIDVSQQFPLLTTRNLSFNIILEELLWFLRGSTNSTELSEKGIKIWNGNSSREFLDNRGLTNYKEGLIGKGYGFQLRNFGGTYDPQTGEGTNGIDQLETTLQLLKTDPTTRRALISFWNPSDLSETALPPCHYSFQFYISKGKYLNMIFNMRSSDLFLATGMNIASYTILLYIFAKKLDLIPGILTYNGGDVHIYSNHISQVEEQLIRRARVLPKLILSDSIKTKKWEEITKDDFTLLGYWPNLPITAKMAI